MPINQLIRKTLEAAAFKNLILDHKFLDRLEHEFELINQKNLAESFLIATTIAETRNSFGFIPEPGKALTTSSLVNYCLGIASLNPLEHGFLFENFLTSVPEAFPWFYFSLPSSHYGYFLQKLSAKLPDKQIVKLVRHPQKIDDDYNAVFIEGEKWEITYGNYLILDRNIIDNIYNINGTLYYPLHKPEDDPKLAFRYFITSPNTLKELETIAKLVPHQYHPWNLPLNDTAVFRFMHIDDEAYTSYLEDPFTQYLARKYKPESIKDVAFLQHLSFCESTDYFQAFDSGNFKFQEYHYHNRQMHNLLSETKGLIAYEEQFMEILHLVCGLSYIEGKMWIKKAVYQKKHAAQNGFLILFKAMAAESKLLSKEDAAVLCHQMERDYLKITQKSRCISNAILYYWVVYYKKYFRAEYDRALPAVRFEIPPEIFF